MDRPFKLELGFFWVGSEKEDVDCQRLMMNKSGIYFDGNGEA